mmetsp:Transcript_22394/g.27437  ORF Transcript_22394/g.27437 Transcript_22394/m.27437 type:complete len:407 (-) Transcript_22394:1043-2263(-)
MCNCCPPTVNALFCLWVRSGCSKASVAGALTFFPPDPALYKFQRYSSNGDPLPDHGDDKESIEYDDDGNMVSSNRTGMRPAAESMRSPTSNSMQREYITDETGRRRPAPMSKKKKEENVHPAQALTDRILALRKKAKSVNERDARDDAAGVTYEFIADPRLATPPSYSGDIEAVKIGPHPKTKNYVAALIYRVRPSKMTSKTKTVIYSHGNATDVGAMYYMQILIAKGLQCNVIVYDYSGYGESGGIPLEHNTYNDIEQVYDYAVKNVVQNADERQIVIYGQSVGSGPSCYICTKKPNVGGLILHSPFMSGMRVLTPSRALACLDIFPNINRITNVKCPVMIIHGVLDEEVHISHGRALHDAVPENQKRNPWWVSDRGHNDITEGRVKLIEYIQRLKGFFESLDRS